MATEKLGAKKGGMQIPDLDSGAISESSATTEVEQKVEVTGEQSGGEQTAEHRRLVPPGGSSGHRKLLGGRAPGQLTMYELQMDMVRMRRGELPEMGGGCEKKKEEKRKKERKEDFDEHVGNVFVQGTHKRVADLHARQKANANEYENYRFEEREFDDRLVFDQQSEDQMIEDRVASETHTERMAAEQKAVDQAIDALAREQQLLEDRWAREKSDDGLFDDDMDYERRRDELLRSGDPNDEQRLLELDLEREQGREEAQYQRDERQRVEREQANDEWRREEFYFHEHNDSLRRD